MATTELTEEIERAEKVVNEAVNRASYINDAKFSTWKGYTWQVSDKEWLVRQKFCCTNLF